MKADIKAKWLEALRSGKYEQGKGLLRSTDNKFCCIGVLCDIANPEAWQLKEDMTGAVYAHEADFTATLPYPLQKRINLFEPVCLYGMNDTGKPFTEIADYIEKNIPADKEVEGLS